MTDIKQLYGVILNYAFSDKAMLVFNESMGVQQDGKKYMALACVIGVN